MCYSAQIRADYRTFVRMFGASLSIRRFVELFFRRQTDKSLLVPRAMDDAFANPSTPEEQQIQDLIAAHRESLATKYEQELFQQRTRKMAAERKLEVKVTKTATEDARIASAKIERAMANIADLKRTEPLERDSRIYPKVYAPVMVMHEGRKIVVPMRYQCRPAGRPASYDVDYPGTYNARRDNLERFWRNEFGHFHGVMLATAFFEHVNRHDLEGRALQPGEAPEDVILKFEPRTGQDMLVACIWSRWTAPGQPDLLSFAAVTDDPPPEVAAAGHDRCIIPIRPEHVDAWLQPDASNLKALYDILDDREQPYYEHRLAA